MFVLFIMHQIINRRWYSALFKGKYTASRVFQTVLNLALLVFMLLQPVSGIRMSKHLYTFLPTFPVSAYARQIHMAFAFLIIASRGCFSFFDYVAVMILFMMIGFGCFSILAKEEIKA